LSNAVKFTPPGGNIDVTAVQKGSTYSVSVEDNGVGMTEETRTRLFRIDSIQTKKGTNDEKGTGLGLILCKEFVTKNNGTITVESTLEEGTVFTFTVAAENDNSETGNYIT
jgi:signal transduction histidine kinase